MAYKTKNSVFKATPTGGTALTLSGDGSGLVAPTFPVTAETREIPSQSTGRRYESVERTSYTFDFTVDLQASTVPLLRWAGMTIAWEFHPNGESTGNPKMSGSAIVESATPADDGGGWTIGVSCIGDGVITHATN